MRIRIWPGIRLSVWEKQNSEAVQVRMPYARLRTPLRRVLSMRGWALILIRYDWRDKQYQPSESDGLRLALGRVQSECNRLEAAVRENPTNADFDGAYLAAVGHIRAALAGRDEVQA